MDEMTPRQRWLAALKLEPVDRLPFWPKIDGAYARVQAEPFREMDGGALHDWIGSDKHEWCDNCMRDVRSRTSIETSGENGTHTALFITPSGTLTRVDRFDEGSQSWHPVEFPVRTADDINVMREWFEDCEVELDKDRLAATHDRVKEIGSDAITTTAIGTSPLMDWVQYMAGVENAHLLLADHTAEVEALFDAMQRTLVRRTELLAAEWPGDLIYAVENTSTSLISPEQFKRYGLGQVGDYARIMHDAGRLLALHMCGYLDKLLPMLATLPVAAFEAFTSATLANTSLLDGRTACPDVCLIGGTNAMLWLRAADEIIAKIEEDLDALPHHRGIVVTSSGVMPPGCKPETIRAVCEWVKTYPVRM